MGKTLLAVIALVFVVIVQINGQANEEEVKFNFKTKELQKKKMTPKEIKAFEKDPKNWPTGDYKPTGTNEPPKSAGLSKPDKPSGKGGVKKQILGGASATLKQFPWQVYLNAFTATGSSWLCGGSLIAADIVLTAAHCVAGASSIKVTAGGITRNTVEATEKSQTSTNFTHHVKYNPNLIQYDIGVIYLPAPFELNDYINVVMLPTNADVNTTFTGTKATASGYGLDSNKRRAAASTVLKFVNLTVISHADCVSAYGSSVLTNTICTKDALTAICSGDSGGPLMNGTRDGLYKLIGIVSFGTSRGCVGGYPCGYVRVTSSLGWISEKTGIQILE